MQENEPAGVGQYEPQAPPTQDAAGLRRWRRWRNPSTRKAGATAARRTVTPRKKSTTVVRASGLQLQCNREALRPVEGQLRVLAQSAATIEAASCVPRHEQQLLHAVVGIIDK